MILVDANLLIYAVNKDLPQHKAARAWWEKVLSGAAPVGIPWVSVLAFVRICTSPRIFAKPLTPEDAVAYVDGWLAQPPVRLVAPGGAHWAILRNLLLHTGAAGNLTTDSHIAALALEHGYAIYSADNDFARFPGLKHINPLFPK
ncbi:MAG: type II toxin-antitoxin system VapC family toxin [Burkholderiales bacterium]|jgi:toxin-antitoxin system PIN domain toxin